MLYKAKIALCLLIFFLITTLSASPVGAAAPERYYWMQSNQFEGHFFDTQTLRFVKYASGQPNPNIVDVWIKIVYSDEGVAKELASRTKRGLPVTNYEYLSHVFLHCRFNKEQRKFMSLGEYHYTKDGSILYEDETPESKGNWDTVIPNSQGDAWFTKTWNYVSANMDTVMKNSL